MPRWVGLVAATLLFLGDGWAPEISTSYPGSYSSPSPPLEIWYLPFNCLAICAHVSLGADRAGAAIRVAGGKVMAFIADQTGHIIS
jgi:hypothetical protein